MAEPKPIWDARTREARAFFAAQVLGPLVLATRPHDLRTPEAIADAATAWILCLKDVPADVLRRGVESLLSAGPRWMPRPGELREACAADLAAQRREVAERAKALTAACERCFGSGWTEVELDGIAHSKRCGCHAAAMEVMAGAPAALALPPARDEREAVE